MTTEEEKISKNRIVRIQESCKMEYSLYKPPYLTGIEGPPPKRNVVSSSLAGGAKTTAVSHFSLVYSGFLLSSLLNGLAAPPERFYTFSAVSLLIGFEHFFRPC